MRSVQFGHAVSLAFAREARGHPNTDVDLTAGRALTNETMALSPALSPSCPREPVIPPLKMRLPSRSKTNVKPEVSAPHRFASSPSTSVNTVTPGIRVALRYKNVSSQSAPELCGFKNKT